VIANSEQFHLYIDFVLLILEVGKSQQSLSFFIFLSNICYTNKAIIELAVYNNIDFAQKRNIGSLNR